MEKDPIRVEFEHWANVRMETALDPAQSEQYKKAGSELVRLLCEINPQAAEKIAAIYDQPT